MACTLTGSQLLDCLDGLGGIKEIKIQAHPGLATIEANFTYSSGTISAIASGSRSGWYSWFLGQQNASASYNPTTNRDAGTTFWAHEFKMMPNKSSARLSNEIGLIAKNRTLVAIRDMNDRYFILGLKAGLSLSAGTGTTGVNRGDKNGYDITLSGQEDLPEQEISSAIWATLVS